MRLLLSYLFCLSLSGISLSVHATTPALLVLGDSLSAAHGLDPEQGWVSLLQQRLRQRGYPHRVVNASLSGETSAGGLSRLPALLAQHQPTLVLVELGANDGLRGLSLKALRQNLAAIIETCQAQEARVLLIGMRLPENYGQAYNQRFAGLYRELAQQYQVALLPFLLEHIALELDLFQGDGLHPVAEAQARLLEHVWQSLPPLLSAPPPQP